MPGLRDMNAHSAAEKLRRGVWHQFQLRPNLGLRNRRQAFWTGIAKRRTWNWVLRRRSETMTSKTRRMARTQS